ncbi:MAG: radical SAM protein [Treponema sp.]|nr:radical SAM protein [Treponema sp.]
MKAEKPVFDTLIVGGIEKESVVDGPGFRYTVFVQGCPRRCPGCHNPQLQSFEGGQELPLAELAAALGANPLLDGLTLSGGEPFCQAGPCAILAERVRAVGLSVMTYTGYRWEELLEQENAQEMRLLRATDILVDGPFIMAERDIDLRFRGSANQRLIDVRQSLAAGKPVILPDDFSAVLYQAHRQKP